MGGRRTHVAVAEVGEAALEGEEDGEAGREAREGGDDPVRVLVLRCVSVFLPISEEGRRAYGTPAEPEETDGEEGTAEEHAG